MAQSTLPPAPHDGSHGNLIARAEPKVKSASLAALLTPICLYYVDRYVPGVATLPTELTAVVGTVVTGALTFAAGYAARAVDRVDLFAKPYAAEAQAAADRTLGARTVDELETWTKDLAAPVKSAAIDAAHTVEAAAAAAEDPVAAAKAEVPDLVDSLDAAIAAGRAEATATLAPVLTQATADAPVLAGDVTAAPTSPKTANELYAELQKMLGRLDPNATPIADAAQAAAQAATAPTPVPAIPAPAGPPTAPMQAVAAGTTAAPVAS